MQKIALGVRRFQKEIFPQKRHLYRRLASGQSPHSLFLTCGDSRVDPELLTGSDPGEIFVERNPGNMVPHYGVTASGGVSASIEFALMVLNVRHVIVCGHSDCGAIKGLLYPERIASLPALGSWLTLGAKARELLDRDFATASDERRAVELTRLNVLQQLQHLETHPAVVERLSRGDLDIYGWIYEIPTGEVMAYNPASRQFEPWPGDS